MKILHITYSDNYGGANIAATRIHKALLSKNINSHLIVIDKKLNLKNTTRYKYVFNFFIKKIRPYIEKIILNILGFKKKASLNILKSNLASYANSEKFDIINFHWINNEMMSLEEIKNFNGKIIWTLHDAWPIENFFHYPEIKHDYLKNIFRSNLLLFIKNYKKKNLRKKKINIISPSKWMNDYAKKNKLFKLNNSAVIKNPINTKFWKPMLLKKKKTKIILFGSVDVNTDERKGLYSFLDKLSHINKFLPDFELYIFGGNVNKNYNYNFKVVNLGYLEPKRLRHYYNLADVYVITSKQDNFPNTAVEAMSCGTPVITVKNNGLKEIIYKKVNGIVLKNFSKAELKNALNWSFKQNNQKKINSIIYNEVSESVISRNYYNYYKKIYYDKN